MKLFSQQRAEVDSLQSLDGSHLPIETSLPIPSPTPEAASTVGVQGWKEWALSETVLSLAWTVWYVADFRDPNQNSNQVGHQPAQPSREPNPLGIVPPGEKPHYLVAVVELMGQIPTSHFRNQRAIRQSGDHRTTNPGSTALAAAYLSKRKLPQDLLGESKQSHRLLSELLSNRNRIPRS